MKGAQMAKDYIVKDISLAAYGRKELDIAETEMPGLMACRAEYGKSKPLKGARIVGSLHMTIQTAVLIETLVELGADVRWASCNIFSTQDLAAAAIAAGGTPVFAIKGQTLEEHWDYLDKSFMFPEGANMILDDGGDATLYVLLGARAEAGEEIIPVPQSEEEEVIKAQIKKRMAASPGWFTKTRDAIKGVSEETTTGVHRLYDLHKKGQLPFPAINVNDSVTKSKNDNKYGCRHSLSDAIKRGTDHLLMGKKALVIGYGDVGKGSAQSLSQEGMIVKVTEIDPICAMQACMDGYEVVSPYLNGINDGTANSVDKALLGNTDLLVTTTGNVNVCDQHMLAALKKTAVVCNIGHFDNEIDTAFMRKAWRWEQVKPQVHKVFRSNAADDYLLLLSEGRLVNLGNATGHPSRIMDGSFANQVLAQMHLYGEKFADLPAAEKTAKLRVEVLPKQLDEEVARYMVQGFGGVITQLTKRQADYIHVAVEGPFKSDDYRY
jgi:adenosylhomocysteinase